MGTKAKVATKAKVKGSNATGRKTTIKATVKGSPIKPDTAGGDTPLKPKNK